MQASNVNAEPFYLTVPMRMNNNHWLLRSHMIPTLTLYHKTNFYPFGLLGLYHYQPVAPELYYLLLPGSK